MDGETFSAPPPFPSAFFGFFRSLLKEFNPRCVAFLDKKGEWAENPVHRRDRIAHHFLFDLWKKRDSASPASLETSLALFFDEQAWSLVQKFGQSRCQGNASLFILESLLWILERWSLRRLAEERVADWNRLGLALKSHFRKELLKLEAELEGVFSEEERDLFSHLASRGERALSSLLEPVVELIAEEEKIGTTIAMLLEEASAPDRRDEAYAAIMDRLQPPMGIVTELPMSLFLPSLRLLLAPEVDVSSGIPYMASVALSIFKDSRSARVLIEALEHYPLACTKIRENLIYTLGHLREETSVSAIARVLEAPDELPAEPGSSPRAPCLLLEQKEEAIWALGKIGHASTKALSSLVRYVDHPSPRLKTYLAWTLGEIGRAQKEKTGGISADLVIALLRFLKEKNKQVFEEAASSLKKIQMPEFLHSLYLYSAGAVSILSLPPAQRGLNELSETIHYLLKTKKRVVVAVNGDSGTGKTYFCQALAGGFGGLPASQILYLMRDSKPGQKIFNRLLGLRWLRQHIDPAYYEDYPMPEAEDNPEAFFRQFLDENADKRLILLDGCRDRHYFQKVIDTFYQHGELDVEVNFRANFSTRRLNLEERERALESVRLHLAFLEEPALEDTSFYQQGLVILYDLDNSLGARLDQEETRQLFTTGRVDSWSEFIRLGHFGGETKHGELQERDLFLESKKFTLHEEKWPGTRHLPFSFEEEILTPRLNDDLEKDPNLLMTVLPGKLDPDRLRFYAQDQVAGAGRKGNVFVLTLHDYRLFQASLGASFLELGLLGRTFFLWTENRQFLGLSFENNNITEYFTSPKNQVSFATWPPDRLITADDEGSIDIWDFAEQKIFRLSADFPPLTALATDPSGKIYASNPEGMWRFDFPRRKLERILGLDAPVRLIRPFFRERILAIEDKDDISTLPRMFICDLAKKSVLPLSVPLPGRINSAHFSADGRIVIGLTAPSPTGNFHPRTLAVLSVAQGACLVSTLGGHDKETRDLLLLGPRIITCGEESDGTSSIRIWGSPFYVRTEMSKLLLRGRTTLTY